MSKFTSRDGQEWKPVLTCSALASIEQELEVELIPRKNSKKEASKIRDLVMNNIGLMPQMLSFCVKKEAASRDMTREQVAELFDEGPLRELMDAFVDALTDFIGEGAEAASKRPTGKGKG